MSDISDYLNAFDYFIGQPNKIDNNQYELILGLLISIGYILTKDGDKSISNNTLEEKVEEKVEEKIKIYLIINNKNNK